MFCSFQFCHLSILSNQLPSRITILPVQVHRQTKSLVLSPVHRVNLTYIRSVTQEPAVVTIQKRIVVSVLRKVLGLVVGELLSRLQGAGSGCRSAVTNGMHLKEYQFGPTTADLTSSIPPSDMTVLPTLSHRRDGVMIRDFRASTLESSK